MVAHLLHPASSLLLHPKTNHRISIPLAADVVKANNSIIHNKLMVCAVSL